MSHPFDRADYRDVQQLGERIGVELPSTLLQSGINQGYPNHRWDYALHELGHLVVERARVKNCDRWLQIPIDEGPVNEGWDEFYQPLLFGARVFSLNDYLALPSEWSVQSWCCEVALAMGWLTPEEQGHLLDENREAPPLRMFWSSSSIELLERWSLQGNSTDPYESWSLRRQHALQIERLARFGVDIGTGHLVPTRTARAEGPFLQVVDALGTVHARIPRTLAPEAAPCLWALWNWSSAFGSLPPGLDLWNDLRGPGWRETAQWWTNTLNEALRQQARRMQDRIQTLLGEQKLLHQGVR